MKRLATVLLMFLFIFPAPSLALEPELGLSLRTAKGLGYVPGELLVRYKRSVSAEASEYFRTRWGINHLRRFKAIDIQHLKLSRGMTVEEALEVYRNDPRVEWAEPNYYRYAGATPNDTDFNQLWGLHNTGQNVNGTMGTEDADIDAPEAWDITTGSTTVVVAVIDSGVDYNHPDLKNNIWTNQGETPGNGIDDDGNGYVDDIRGWDFVDNDNNPIDSPGHGTHVAGTIAAVGNNLTGVTGVCWTVKIIPLRFVDATGFGTVLNEVEAIDYAIQNGANIINASFGSGSYSGSEYTAISRARDAGILFVAAAGNGGTDNDLFPYYPSNYDLDNIVAVAATDQYDKLAWFSNYGATSVDVAAPGTNIYNCKPGRQTVWGDDFENVFNWTTGGVKDTWGTSSSFSSSGSFSLTESPAGNYENNTDSWARAPVLNLSTHNGTKLEFKVRGRSETNYDLLYVQASTDLLSWNDREIEIGGELYAGISGTFSGWVSATVDLGAYDRKPTVYIRFRFTSDDTVIDDGWYIDDVAVSAASASYDGTEYRFLQGTSMATPHVSGLAALILSDQPALTAIQVKERILNCAEGRLIDTDGLNLVLTGGRINAFNSLRNVPASPGGGDGGGCFIATSACVLPWKSRVNPGRTNP
jgi:subtilisin family serine protease